MNNHHQAHLYVPDKLWNKFVKLAEENRRTINAEIMIAMEKRLDRLDAERKYARKKRQSFNYKGAK